MNIISSTIILASCAIFSSEGNCYWIIITILLYLKTSLKIISNVAKNDKLLVALGNDALDMQLIDLRNGSSCKIPNFFPENFEAADAIGFLRKDEKITTICPYNFGPVSEKLCWNLDLETMQWSKGPKMLDNANHPSVVALDNGNFWIGGGEDMTYFWKDSEEFKASTGEFVPSIQLPSGKSRACAVGLGNGKVFMVGGYPFSRRAIIVDTKTGEITEQVSYPFFKRVGKITLAFFQPMAPSMRENPVCGLSKDLDGNRILIYAGGDKAFDAEKTMNIYNFKTETWSNGKDMPYPLTGPTNVPYGDTFLAVGGDLAFDYYCSRILTFDIPSQSMKIVEEVKLSLPSMSPVAVLVPNHITC